MEIVKKPHDIWEIMDEMESAVLELQQTRNLSEIMLSKFIYLNLTEGDKLQTYHEFETLMPILHDKIHNPAKQLNELFSELWEAMKYSNKTSSIGGQLWK